MRGRAQPADPAAFRVADDHRGPADDPGDRDSGLESRRAVGHDRGGSELDDVARVLHRVRRDDDRHAAETRLAEVASARRGDHVPHAALRAGSDSVQPGSSGSFGCFVVVRVFSMRNLVSLDGIRIVGVLTLILIFGGGALFAAVETTTTTPRGMGSGGPSRRSRPPPPPTSAPDGRGARDCNRDPAHGDRVHRAAHRLRRRSLHANVGRSRGPQERILAELRDIRAEIETLKRR